VQRQARSGLPRWPQGHGRVAFFSNLRIRRECLKPEAIYRAPSTLGQHLAARRRELNLLQRDAAEQVGVCESTFLHWEQNATTPPVTFLPRICAFLGYDPLPAAVTTPERMKRYRERNGYTVKTAAEQLGIDPGTWSAWELGRVIPWPRFRAGLNALIDN
jgi:transcriptional regulator with XRE-family HTH domain